MRRKWYQIWCPDCGAYIRGFQEPCLFHTIGCDDCGGVFSVDETDIRERKKQPGEQPKK